MLTILDYTLETDSRYCFDCEHFDIDQLENNSVAKSYCSKEPYDNIDHAKIVECSQKKEFD